MRTLAASTYTARWRNKDVHSRLGLGQALLRCRTRDHYSDDRITVDSTQYSRTALSHTGTARRAYPGWFG